MPLDDMNQITPDLLKTEPSLLLHNKGTHTESLTAFDGKVGAVVADGHFFITSPNIEVIYEPPLGAYCEMRFRRDYKYSDDDPLQWPQPYNVPACHWACMPLLPAPDDPYRIMWSTPAESDWVPSTTGGVVSGMGLLTSELLKLLGRAIMVLKLEVKRYMTNDRFPEKSILVQQLSSSLDHTLQRLQSLPMTRREVLFGMALLQRDFRSLMAALKYLTVCQPRMLGCLPPATELEIAVGAFTHDTKIAQDFVRAGLPVWLVRSYDQVPVTHVDTLVMARKPAGNIIMADMDPLHGTFFRRNASDEKQLSAFDTFIAGFYRYPNPFQVGLPPSSPPPPTSTSSTAVMSSLTTTRQPESSLSSVSGLMIPALLVVCSADKSRTGHQAHAQPYGKRDNKGAGSRAKFTELERPFIPPAVPAWKDALASVNTKVRVAFQGPDDSAYAFPDPGLFYGVQSEEKRMRFIHNWLRNRPAMIFRLSSSTSSARPLSNQCWRTILNYGQEAASGEPSSSTKGAQIRHNMRELLGNCLDQAGITLELGNDNLSVFWHEQQLSAGAMPSLDISREILWELYELNFCFELLALDHRAQQISDDSDRRQSLIRACFPGGGSILVVDVDLAGQGLSAPTLTARAPYLVALRRVMKDWSGNTAAALGTADQRVEDYSLEDLKGLEHDVAQFYTQSFFNNFGHAAIIPHSLTTT
ncbi:hypothetical protein Hypma_013215 [Hypsizygus marmoreus]|uniref:Uncharacterized protein n=1 Tax=Hypsizygus marmoreus TaxID=39966 RepID=A0A369JCU1_HYPMA|nr:hypothetical protein Hypma_013215 [Hypsizygus marmoreus]